MYQKFELPEAFRSCKSLHSSQYLAYKNELLISRVEPKEFNSGF